MEAITIIAALMAAVATTSTVLLALSLRDARRAAKEIRDDNIDKIDKITDLTVNNEQLEKGNRELQQDLFGAQDELGTEREKNRQLLSQKKSSETRLGQISEHIIPFLANCPYDPKNLHFLGNPVDYVCFDFDQGAITFIEVKSGNSKPSKRQKIVKNIVKTGRVYYDEIRINEKGVRRKHVSGYDHRPRHNHPGNQPPAKSLLGPEHEDPNNHILLDGDDDDTEN